jgi:hypothetical protein
VPEAIAFATKPQLAQRMIERALTAGVPVSWVLGDEVYGNDRRLRIWLEQHERPHVLAVKAPLWALVAGQGAIQVPAKDLATPLEGWRRLSAGAGVKGERLYDWARFRLFRLQQAPWDHWLLVRRKLSKPDEMAYYVVFGPAATSLEALARIGAGRSRSASRRPSRRSGWTATRCAAGTAGTGTSPCRCWRSPFWRRCGSNSPPKGGGRSGAFVAFSMPEIRRLITRFQVSSASTSFSHGRSGVGSIRPSPKPATGNDRPPNS